MKKKLAFSIAGATAAVIGGWKLVQQLVDRDDDGHPAPAGPAPSPVPKPTAAATTPPSTAPAPAAGPGPAVEGDESPQEAKYDEPDKETSKSELYDMATELGIKGRSKMSKKELRKAIRDAS
mgnify:CR=1 FL=1